MDRPRLLIVTGDHELADATKWGGGYTDSDRELHDAMVAAFRSLDRFEVEVMTRHGEFSKRMTGKAPDLVVNFCDTGFNNIAAQELHVPALLEIHGLAYTGAPPAAMVYCYDKELVSLLARHLDIPVPREVALRPGAPLPDSLSYPALVKPASGDGSVGINQRARVQNRGELESQLEWLWGEMPGVCALVQEYLPGPEYGLGLIGNPGAFEALPMLEVDFSSLPSDLPPILAFESKTGPTNPYDDVVIKPAQLSADEVSTIRSWAEALFSRLGCRDYARFDFRRAADGSLRLLEVNPNPAWSRAGKLARMAAFGAKSYPTLLESIVEAALRRVG